MSAGGLTDAERELIAMEVLGRANGHGISTPLLAEGVLAAVALIKSDAVAFVADERDAAIKRANFLADQARDNAQKWPARIADAVAAERERITAAVEAVLAEWDGANLTPPGHDGEPESDRMYRLGFYKAVSIARAELRAALTEQAPR